MEIDVESKRKKVARIDIVVFYEGLIYPIEIKFRKTRLNEPCYESGLEIMYRNQDAPDDAAYYYINDIYRIQQFCKKYIDRCKRGYTLFVTNQIRYVNGGYNKRIEWKDINIFKTEGKVKIPSRVKGKVSGINRTFLLNRDYETQWEEFVIENNKFYLFWNEIVL